MQRGVARCRAALPERGCAAVQWSRTAVHRRHCAVSHRRLARPRRAAEGRAASAVAAAGPGFEVGCLVPGALLDAGLAAGVDQQDVDDLATGLQLDHGVGGGGVRDLADHALVDALDDHALRRDPALRQVPTLAALALAALALALALALGRRRAHRIPAPDLDVPALHRDHAAVLDSDRALQEDRGVVEVQHRPGDSDLRANGHDDLETRGKGTVLSHEGGGIHKAKALSSSRRQWNTQGKGSVSVRKAVEHTRQRQCLSHEGSGTHKAKAVS